MEKASRALRRSSVKLLSMGGHSDLNVMLSEVKDIRHSAKAFMSAQNLASQDMLRWAAHQENRALQDVISQMSELNVMWTEAQRDFAEQLKEYREMFEQVLVGEKHVDQAKTHLTSCEQKEVKTRKELKKAAKNAPSETIRILESRLSQAERGKDAAQIEVSDRIRENEAVKLIRIKQGMTKISEAYVDMARKCALIFTAQKNVVSQLPDVHGRELEEIKYTGTGTTRFIVQECREMIHHHRRGSRFSLEPEGDNEPPPPYTPPEQAITVQSRQTAVPMATDSVTMATGSLTTATNNDNQEDVTGQTPVTMVTGEEEPIQSGEGENEDDSYYRTPTTGRQDQASSPRQLYPTPQPRSSLSRTPELRGSIMEENDRSVEENLVGAVGGTDVS